MQEYQLLEHLRRSPFFTNWLRGFATPMQALLLDEAVAQSACCPMALRRWRHGSELLGV